MLEVKGLNAFYGNIQALHSLDMRVESSEIVALIGSNGAGKTTLLNSLSGHVKTTGEIIYDGKPIHGMKPHAITARRILHVPEGRHVFPGLTVEQNLVVGTVANRKIRISQGNVSEELEMVYGIFPKLRERYKQLAWSLSGGEQQMLAIGRALMGKPKLLLMDEPSMGLAPIIIEEMFAKIVEIHQTTGMPMLLVEQNASLALGISHRAYIIERGRITAQGNSKELANDPKVREAYLGKSRVKKHEEKADEATGEADNN